MRIDWPGLLDDLGWAIARKRWGQQRAVWKALQDAGFKASRTQVRAWFRGRERPRDPDIAVWLTEEMARRGFALRRLSDACAPCETSDERCSQP